MAKDQNTLNYDLLMAAYQGNLSIVKTRLKQGADINATDDSNCTPLILAIMEGQVDVVRFLIKQGANLDIKADGDSDALDTATWYKEHGYSSQFGLNGKPDPQVILDLVQAAVSKKNQKELDKLVDGKGSLPINTL